MVVGRIPMREPVVASSQRTGEDAAVKKQAGFTLIELMVVLAIVAILAAIAIPSFNNQLKRSRRAEAMKSLSDLQLREERYRASNTTYGAFADIISPATTTNYNAANDYYTMSVTGVSATGYTLTATPKNSQIGQQCGNFVLTNTNGTIRKSTSSGLANCW